MFSADMETGYGRGTIRGNIGSLGNSTDQMYAYEIFVYKKDFE